MPVQPRLPPSGDRARPLALPFLWLGVTGHSRIDRWT